MTNHNSHIFKGGGPCQVRFTICFGCSKEPYQREGSFEYPQQMIWLRNKKIKFSLSTVILGVELYSIAPLLKCSIDIYLFLNKIYRCDNIFYYLVNSDKLWHLRLILWHLDT